MPKLVFLQQCMLGQRVGFKLHAGTEGWVQIACWDRGLGSNRMLGQRVESRATKPALSHAA
eukprot:838893-Pelagomonas_calceolata.AAC.4